ncbi:MAG: peptidyl-tRNA hydrolase Pth2 [Candidatus Thermoplasmatota archaeon]
MSKENSIDFEYKMVLISRKDLPLSPGKLAVQVAHAAVECTLLTKQHKSVWFSKWHREGGKKVVVKVDCLDDFFKLKNDAEKLGIAAVIITDAGLTEIPEGTQTVLGLGPAPAALLDRITGSLSLL